MSWVSGIVLYIMIWWVALFAVLPIGTTPSVQPDQTSGWRGAPVAPRLVKKLVMTSCVAAVVWLLAYAIITSDYLSFRSGLLAPSGP